MSTEEDTELKNLVAQTLENKGILPKIRAELRANVFLALEENPATRETLLKNDELSAFVKIPVGCLILNLIREFLEFFELEFTLSVFDPETKYGKDYSSLAKDKMMKELKIRENKNNNPLLYEVIERVINSNDPGVLNSEKHQGFGQVYVAEDDVPEQLLSPLVFNSTYVKEKLDESIPLSPLVKKNILHDEKNEMVKEDLTFNCISDLDSQADLHTDFSPKVGNAKENMPLTSNPKDSKLNSPKSVPNNVADIDLLTFTPVKEIKKENIKTNSLPLNNETKSNSKRESEKPLSILGDLPPLTIKSDESGDKIHKIKAIIDKWPGLEKEDESLSDSKFRDELSEENSRQLLKSDVSEHSLKSDRSESSLKSDKSEPSLKSDRSEPSLKSERPELLLRSDRSEPSQKSDRTEQSQKTDQTGSVDDFEEDISDLLNGHTTAESQLTLDETISRVSCDADYLESV